MLGTKRLRSEEKEFIEMRIAVNTPTVHSKSDADLVLEAQNGDSEAFAALFNAHKAKVYSICLRMTCNSAEAEDLTQDVFLHVFRKLGTFRRDSAFSTWLYRVTVNTVLMRFRKKRICQLSLDEPVTHGNNSHTREYGKVDHELMGVVDRIAVGRAMKELPAGYRTVFLLHEVKGYEHHDIARILRCSIGTSKSQLHKAKSRIRELIGMDKHQRRVSVEKSTRTSSETSWMPLGPMAHDTWNQTSEAA
jgi:RNA polymerase sigma-70 factor, ECF subfamily